MLRLLCLKYHGDCVLPEAHRISASATGKWKMQIKALQEPSSRDQHSGEPDQGLKYFTSPCANATRGWDTYTVNSMIQQLIMCSIPIFSSPWLPSQRTLVKDNPAEPSLTHRGSREDQALAPRRLSSSLCVGGPRVDGLRGVRSHQPDAAPGHEVLDGSPCQRPVYLHPQAHQGCPG